MSGHEFYDNYHLRTAKGPERGDVGMTRIGDTLASERHSRPPSDEPRGSRSYSMRGQSITRSYNYGDALSGITNTEPWTAGALCRQTDPELFFPEGQGASRLAKSICARCDVRSECLEWALRTDERHAIAGGLTERERRALKRGAA